MAIEQKRGAGQQAWIHAHSLAAINLDKHETLPAFAIAFGFGLEFAQEVFFELQDFSYIHARDQRLGGRNSSVSQQNILELIATRRQDRGAFVDLGWIKEIQD